jgi:signal recognition particle GTPase
MMRGMALLQSLLGPPLLEGGAEERQVDERELDRLEAIILSMTSLERRRPDLIKASRRLRNTSVHHVNQLVKQFSQTEAHEVARQEQPFSVTPEGRSEYPHPPGRVPRLEIAEQTGP